MVCWAPDDLLPHTPYDLHVSVGHVFSAGRLFELRQKHDPKDRPPPNVKPPNFFFGGQYKKETTLENNAAHENHKQNTAEEVQI